MRERELNFRIEAPLSREEYWHLRSATSGTLREKLAQVPDEQRQQIASEVIETVREYFPNGQMSFPAQMLVISAEKP